MSYAGVESDEAYMRRTLNDIDRARARQFFPEIVARLDEAERVAR